MNSDINCVFEGIMDMGKIFISNIKAAENTELLKKLNIKSIVTVARGRALSQQIKCIQPNLYIAADDIESYDLSQHFNETYKFIDEQRKKTNVLVHYYAGISRSATIVIAYLMRKYKQPMREVICMVKRKRTNYKFRYEDQSQQRFLGTIIKTQFQNTRKKDSEMRGIASNGKAKYQQKIPVNRQENSPLHLLYKI